ncbi:hypothetical protein RIN58_10480 [Siccibacter colletis]|uniref:hypothetical protein n=1 Tax=Siccibacter colletis TaxID=1505757 RepID=UPI0028BF54EF|nr:hypothetical protein [Siccibacter colletis]WNN46864.1 hypothetical protein RIN58_10480 [Siccibacter colletis]
MTHYSDPLKLKTQADRKLVGILDRSVSAVGQSIYELASETLSGMERASWLSSCLIPGKSEVCKEIRHEDVRFILGKKEILTRQDIVLDMVELYFKRKVAQLHSSDERSLLIQIAEHVVGIAVDKATGNLGNYTLAYFLAIMVLSSRDFKDAYAKSIIKNSGYIISSASLYGQVQIAALAARKLKNLHPAYYWDLYSNNIEMVYHIIEEPMSKIMYLIDSGSDDVDELTFLINDLVRK